eukprot:873486_1
MSKKREGHRKRRRNDHSPTSSDKLPKRARTAEETHPSDLNGVLVRVLGVAAFALPLFFLKKELKQQESAQVLVSGTHKISIGKPQNRRLSTVTPKDRRMPHQSPKIKIEPLTKSKKSSKVAFKTSRKSRSVQRKPKCSTKKSKVESSNVSKKKSSR